MDEAALLIRFRDETDPQRAGGASTAQGTAASGGIPGTNQGAEFQDGLSQAGATARQANEGAMKPPLAEWPSRTFAPVPTTGAAPVPDAAEEPIGQPQGDGLDDLRERMRNAQSAIDQLRDSAEGFEEVGDDAGSLADALEVSSRIAGQIPGMSGVSSFLSKAAAVPGAGLIAVPSMAAVAGPVLAAGAGFVAAAAGVAATVSVAETARGQIGGLSGEVAAAEAEARVRQLVANMRTAEILGDEVASFIENQSRLNAAGQGIRDVAFERPLAELNKIVGILTTIAETADGFAQDVRPILGTLQGHGINTLLENIVPGLSWLKGILDRMTDANKKDENASAPWTRYANEPHLPLPAWLGESDQAPSGDPNFAPIPGLAL